MTKLLYTSFLLTVFSLSIILFQISCQEEAIAGPGNSETQTKFLYSKAPDTGGWTYWTANLDGTNHQQIPISLPNSEKVLGYGNLTSNGETLVFNARNSTNTTTYVYSVSLDGTNLKKLHEINESVELHIVGFY